MAAGGFLQSAIKNFIGLRYGLSKNVAKLEDKYKKLFQGQDLCKKNTKDLQKIIKSIIDQLNTIIKIIKSILSILNKLSVFISFIKKMLSGLTILIKVLKSLPIPSMYTVMGVVMTLSDLLSKINFLVKSTLVITTGFDLIIRFAAASLKSLITIIQGILASLTLASITLKACGKSALTTDLDQTISDTNNTITDLTDLFGSLLTDNNSYRGFTFNIIEEQTVDKAIATRRYAIAINANGVLILQGEASYASDTQVLIDELKLRIDSGNLTGYNGITTSDKDSDIINDFNLDDPSQISEISKNINNELQKVINDSAGQRSIKDELRKFLK